MTKSSYKQIEQTRDNSEQSEQDLLSPSLGAISYNQGAETIERHQEVSHELKKLNELWDWARSLPENTEVAVEVDRVPILIYRYPKDAGFNGMSVALTTIHGDDFRLGQGEVPESISELIDEIGLDAVGTEDKKLVFTGDKLASLVEELMWFRQPEHTERNQEVLAKLQLKNILAWARSLSPDTVVGETEKVDGCPIHRYLKDIGFDVYFVSCKTIYGDGFALRSSKSLSIPVFDLIFCVDLYGADEGERTVLADRLVTVVAETMFWEDFWEWLRAKTLTQPLQSIRALLKRFPKKRHD